MKSSTGNHFVGLDHVRALAALMVFIWHFTHSDNGYPVPFEGAPTVFPLALLDEGHTGVALFMVLSGYLFAKLIDGKDVSYLAFFWNRVIRLAPMLLISMLLTWYIAFQGNSRVYFESLIIGLIRPEWPNGTWSITVECHFYLVLPVLLYLTRKWRFAPFTLILLAIAARCAIFLMRGEVQNASYWTIIGRADNFLFGVAAFYFSPALAKRTALAICVALAFSAYYWWFDEIGGWYQLAGAPSRSPLWIVMPTIEGAAYGVLVAYYDATFSPPARGLSWAISKIGEYSYSIYLLHFYFVFTAARFIHNRVMDISNFYVATAWGLACFCLMIPIAYLSFRFIEKPILKFRKPYVISGRPVASPI